ncbi:MAG: hypothetical protein KAT77_02610 [Nanoarchaeota archaeon]|nr:hypothetical protein [Nanoarchaeota archaeon]
MTSVKQRLEEGWIQARIVLEIIGKPKGHVEKTMQDYVEKIKKEKDLEVLHVDINEVQKQETGAKDEKMVKEMWATFAELEILFKNLPRVTYFCFEYMPSSIEIIEPQNLQVNGNDLTSFFTDLQMRLHEIDMIAKQQKSQTMFWESQIKGLLRNFVMVALSSRELTADELSKITGVQKNTLEDFLDELVDKNEVKMVGEKYRKVLDGKKQS